MFLLYSDSPTCFRQIKRPNDSLLPRLISSSFMKGICSNNRNDVAVSVNRNPDTQVSDLIPPITDRRDSHNSYEKLFHSAYAILKNILTSDAKT